MAEICRKLATDTNDPEPCGAKSRAARRRRIEMRRNATLTGAAASPENAGRRRKKMEKSDTAVTGKDCPAAGASLSSTSLSNLLVGAPGVAESQAGSSSSRQAKALLPDFGSISIFGRSREMEDAVSVHLRFFQLSESGEGDFLHFFAVYDGHGGAHVATLCKERLHKFLAEELGSVSDSGKVSPEEWKRVMKSCFRRVDEEALRSCSCGNAVPCGCQRAGLPSDVVGSTAVVAILGRDQIVVANCGDSRAVLCRGGRSIPLSIDHKPDRPDELMRIEEAGGRVIYLNGARVLGILAMSRAIGDKYLKPIVISEPETSITEITREDDCLILASDGLWDVLSNDLACEVAKKCLHGRNTAETTARILNDHKGIDDQNSESRCSLAAALLARLALARKSGDNISIIVIDLKSI